MINLMKNGCLSAFGAIFEFLADQLPNVPEGFALTEKQAERVLVGLVHIGNHNRPAACSVS